jgi:hypothetical protein
MKNNIKLFSVAALGALLMTSCIQEVDPQSSTVTVEQASNANGAYDNFVSAITNSLAGSFLYSSSSQYPFDYGYPTFYLMRDVMGQDIAIENNDWYTSWYSCGTALGPQYAYCQVPWTYYYGWIKGCNEVINMAGEEPAEDKIAGAGIAYAMRAMFYLDMARIFGVQTYAKNKEAETVPLVVETTSVADLATNPRATNEVIFAQILSDLDKAEEYLANYKRSDVYTPDLSVVYGLKARAYLTMEDWANAQAYAKKAQEGYTMMSESEYLSRTDGFNTPNSSWMFGLYFKDTDAVITNNDGDSSWGAQMIVEVSESGCGYAGNYGQPKRIDYHLYQTIPATDFRKKCFIDFAIDDMSEADALDALSEYSDVPEGLLTTAAATNSKMIGGIELKFRPKDGEHANQYKAFTVSVPIMRVEEMKLIEAEAAGMQNESAGIQLLTAFAQTRDASYVYGQHQTESYGGNATQFQNEVWWQRRVELWGEGFATFDIKRLDKQIIRSYEGTNHVEGNRWNKDAYKSNAGNNYPEWMDWCIVQSETNYNAACTNNPAPTKPTADSPEYKW